MFHPKVKRTIIKPSYSDRYIGKKLKSVRARDRVKIAIRLGAQTQKEIIRKTRLPQDVVGELIAELLIDRNEIGTSIIDGVRIYFIAPRRKPMVKAEPRSYGVSTIYFAA